MGGAGDTLNEEENLQSTYVNCCGSLPDDKTVIVVGSHRVEGVSDLLYAPVSIGGQSTLSLTYSVKKQSPISKLLVLSPVLTLCLRRWSLLPVVA